MIGPVGFSEPQIQHNNSDLACERGHADVPQIPMPEWSEFYAPDLTRAGIVLAGGAL